MLFIGCYIVPDIYPLGTRKQKTPNNRICAVGFETVQMLICQIPLLSMS